MCRRVPEDAHEGVGKYHQQEEARHGTNLLGEQSKTLGGRRLLGYYISKTVEVNSTINTGADKYQCCCYTLVSLHRTSSPVPTLPCTRAVNIYLSISLDLTEFAVAKLTETKTVPRWWLGSESGSSNFSFAWHRRSPATIIKRQRMSTVCSSRHHSLLALICSCLISLHITTHQPPTDSHLAM